MLQELVPNLLLFYWILAKSLSNWALFFCPSILHIFFRRPWADSCSSSPPPPPASVWAVINGFETTLDSWLRSTGCRTTYWDITHIRMRAQTDTHKQLQERLDSDKVDAAPSNHSRLSKARRSVSMDTARDSRTGTFSLHLLPQCT